MNISKGVALILAFFPLTGLYGFDKFYTGNYIQGIISIILFTTLIGSPIALIWNIVRVIILLILIFLGETSIFEYTVGLIIIIYLIFRYKYIYDKIRDNNINNKSKL